jgi:hypothetical protein
MVGEPYTTTAAALQDNQLMSKRCVLGFKPHLDFNGDARTARTK